MEFEWRLKQVMAERGLWKSTELAPLLEQHGVELSRSQLYRLVNQMPERLNATVLGALCVALDCSVSELLARPSPTNDWSPTPRGRRAASTVLLENGAVLMSALGTALVALEHSFELPEEVSAALENQWPTGGWDGMSLIRSVLEDFTAALLDSATLPGAAEAAVDQRNVTFATEWWSHQEPDSDRPVALPRL